MYRARKCIMLGNVELFPFKHPCRLFSTCWISLLHMSVLSNVSEVVIAVQQPRIIRSCHEDYANSSVLKAQAPLKLQFHFNLLVALRWTADN